MSPRTRFVPTAAGPVEPAQPTDRVELSFGSPPPDLLAEVQSAARRARELAAQNRELHFSTDKETGRVIVQVRDLEGHVIKTIPAARALDVMAGAAL